MSCLENEKGHTEISFFNRQIIRSAESMVDITVAAAGPKTPSLNNTTNMRLKNTFAIPDRVSAKNG